MPLANSSATASNSPAHLAARIGEVAVEPSDLVERLNSAANYSANLAPIAVGGGVLAVLSLAWHPVAAVIVVCATVLALANLWLRSKRLSQVQVRYEIPAEAAGAFRSVVNAAGWFAASRGTWVASSSGSRSDASVNLRENPWYLSANVVLPSVRTGSTVYLFAPDAMLILGDSGASAIAYSSMMVRLGTSRTVENGGVPPDADEVGSTWLYANKNGSPDRRRGGNRRIPVLEYATVTIDWRRSNVTFVVSNREAARHFATSIAQASGSPLIDTAGSTSVPARPARPQVAAPRFTITRSADLARIVATEAARPGVTLAPSESRHYDDAAWVPAGHEVTIGRYRVPGMIYSGKYLRAQNGRMIEPALVDPTLPTDDAQPNHEGEGIGYWPSYSTLSARSRAAYLHWQTTARSDPAAYIGYVFIFFYGLERRVYQLMNARAGLEHELVAISAEVSRLTDLYGPESGSFSTYAGSLLALLATLSPECSRFAQNQVGNRTGELSMTMKIALAELAAAGKPLPPDLAFDCADALSYFSTPAQRCADEFRALFRKRYAARFADGVILKCQKKTLQLSYQPASAGLSPLTNWRTDLPEVSATGSLNRIVELAQECCSALDQFSRFLGKNPAGRGTIDAIGALPEDLVTVDRSSEAAAMVALVESRLGHAEHANLGAGELLAFVRIANPGRVAKTEAIRLIQSLEKLGYGVEPDVRFGGPVFDLDDSVVLFKRRSDCPSVPSDEYNVASICLRLASAVAAADGEVSESEQLLLQAHVSERLGLNDGERQRLAGHLAWLGATDRGMSGLVKKLAALEQKDRKFLGELLVRTAASDGHIDPREMKTLEKAFALLQLPLSMLYAAAHAAQRPDDEPVLMTAVPGARSTFAIPPKPNEQKAPIVDMQRVHAKIVETRQVSKLLADIFEEEPEAAPGSGVQPPAVVQHHSRIGDLDLEHSQLMRRLASRASWSRADVEEFAAEMALLTDGALETLNDYAYATFDEPFWEETDPVVVNQTIAMEILK